MRILSHRDLPLKGITWSREHTRRMWQAGKFPKPFKLAERGHNVWDEAEIDAWLELRSSQRSRVPGVKEADRATAA
jgi:predicted DNA-binding transcriptional regulator AlpA